MQHKPWTEQDLTFLKENSRDMTINELSEKMDRTFFSVKNQIYNLNLDYQRAKYTEKKWSEEEINLLTEKVNSMSFVDIVSQYMPYRSVLSVHNKVRALGLKRDKFKIPKQERISREEKFALIDEFESLKKYPEFDIANPKKMVAHCRMCRTLISTNFKSFSGYCRRCTQRDTTKHDCAECGCLGQFKICSSCKREFPLETFGKSVLSPNGHDYSCRKCQREKFLALVARNKAANKGHLCSKDGCFTETVYCPKCDMYHPRVYYAIAMNAKTVHRPPCAFMLYKRMAKERGIKFDLCQEQFWQLMMSTENCEYCGISLAHRRPSIDRINNISYYHIDNVAICCYICNYIKYSSHPRIFFYELLAMSQMGDAQFHVFRRIKKRLSHNAFSKHENYQQALDNYVEHLINTKIDVDYLIKKFILKEQV